MSPTSLDRFQKEILAGFFRKENRFFLTGGAALVGFFLGHRTTKDLDLFTTQDRLQEGVTALQATASELEASLEALRTSPDFRRFLLKRASETVVVDLVRDLAPQIFPEKLVMEGGIQVDPPEEIFANKICTLLSRAEIRDLIDVRALEAKGYSLERALEQASQKDAGLTPGQLAWVLSQVEIGEDATPPGGVSAAELREYLQSLRDRLARLAFPEESGTKTT